MFLLPSFYIIWYIPDIVGVTMAVITGVIVGTILDIIVRLDKVGDTKPGQNMKYYMKLIPCLHYMFTVYETT